MGIDDAAARAAVRGVLRVAWPNEWAARLGVAAVAAGCLLTLVAPPTLLSFGLGILAAAGLSRDRRLGVLPAALLAVIAVPYGRAADNDLASVAGIPLRFQDGAVLMAAVLSMPALRRLSLRGAPVRLALLWLAIGVGATMLALVGETPVRDILRDVRWWVLYGFLAVALWARTSRPAILRAVVLGATIFSVMLFATAILPAFDGGLKERALAYDRGLLRLQFSNAVFVIVAATWLLHRVLQRPAIGRATWFGFLAAGVLLSLTRVSIFVLLGVVGLSLAIHAMGRRRGGDPVEARRPRASRGLLALLAIPVLIAGGAFVVTIVGTSAQGGPFDRLLFLAPNSDFDAIARGRGETYDAALRIVGESPLVGHGLGTLVPFEFTPGGSRSATPGMQPGVDNAYQTVALKAGLVGVIAFVLLVGWPLVELARRPRDRLLPWFGVAWLGALAMTATQSFATTGYGPFGLALLMALVPARPLRAGRRAR